MRGVAISISTRAA